MGPFPRWVVVTAMIVVFAAGAVNAWLDPVALGHFDASRGDKTLIADGSYVINVGELHMNVTNHGLIGSQYSIVSSYSDAPSGQWPGGSGIEYLFSAGLWVGGVKNGETRVSTGQYQREFRPEAGPDNTIYEARFGQVTRPYPHSSRAGARVFEPNADDDGDGRMNEEVLNGLDDDGDGLIDEDFDMLGSQMLVCTMVDNTGVAQEEYADHEPLGLEVVQTAYAWEMEDVDDFIVFAYDITNIGTSSIADVIIGMQVDCDIGRRGHGEGAFDDMAGRYTGMARASNGLFETVDVAYMYDGHPTDPVPGYFGVMFRGPSTVRHKIRSFQRYTGERPYALGGMPTNDAERYEELSKTRSDPNVEESFEADYHFLVSNGPWGTLSPNRTLHVEVVFVVGDGLKGLLENAANAQQTWEGAWYDLDNNYWTGRWGRESLECLQDYGYDLDTFGLSWFAQTDERYTDLSCVPYWAVDLMVPDDFFSMGTKDCIWANMDNCEECENIRGLACTPSNFFNYWNCGNWWTPVGEKEGCTGVGGRESVVRWITDAAPPPPDMRVWPRNGAVHVYWNDDSQHSRDMIHDTLDFESYQVWRAEDWKRPSGTSVDTGPEGGLWQLVAEYDLDNLFFDRRTVQGITIEDTLELGDNTGLEDVVYRPRCLDDPRFDGLTEAMESVLAAGLHTGVDLRPPVRDADGAVIPGMEPLLPWEGHAAELDTFYWATPWQPEFEGQGSPKRGKTFYEFVDRNVLNGFLYFYSVTATDHRMYMDGDEEILTGPGEAGDPSTSFSFTSPGTDARTADDIDEYGQRIYVYPNPATSQSLADFQQLSPNSDDPTGVRVAFANLPRSRNRIDVFTLDGDLVTTILHDGTEGFGEATWNLVSRNGQQIVSGVYLYSVRSDAPGFKDFIGKFVVIR